MVRRCCRTIGPGSPSTAPTRRRTARPDELTVPLLLLWSLGDDLEDLYGDPLRIWADWADDVRGHGIDSTHHMAEVAPEVLAAVLADFFVEA